MKICLGVCALFGAWSLIWGVGLAAAEPNEACRLLTSRFAAAPGTVASREMVDLTTCISMELGVRAGVVESSTDQPGAPPTLPPNVFPSPSVPSPQVPSPVIPTPEQFRSQAAPPSAGGRESAAAQAMRHDGASSPARPRPSASGAPRYFGQWQASAPWVSIWPEPGPWERP
jgi:hypothetical protein